MLSPEEEREFWSAVGANDVSREKLSRVLDRLASLLVPVLYHRSYPTYLLPVGYLGTGRYLLNMKIIQKVNMK